MEKSNEPTYSQIQTLYRWIGWHMSNDEARHAVQWLKSHATRREVSAEVKRIGDLYHSHSLDKAECFNSKIWERYEG